ncbi:hypothetical protein [Chondrinema litorale]|uniref:hypothetical protein n=1 Tax=Chondrinema litorale TaxID=2994555 RepID=UPI002543BCAA|nr:hypothetical protein [Chondrinema litorale]UZS00271.1 hypothetical protein OQ292_40735 [Chondrinema litorale]
MALHRLFINRYFNVQGAGNKYVSTYWNDSTSAINVYASDVTQPDIDTDTPNGGQIAGGNDDPTATAPNQPIASYKFCNGGTLNQFGLIASYPYAERKQTANSYQCVVTVCDLEIDYVEKIADSINQEYTLRAKATSSNGPIQYSLNDVDYQNSNEFTEQVPGTVTIYAKDANNCRASYTVELEAFPAYAQAYQITIDSRLHNTVVFKIYKLDYEGLVSTISEATQSPLLLQTGKKNDDKYLPFKTSQLVFSPISVINDEFFPFNTASEYDYKCELLVNGNIEFTGYLNPSLAGDPLKAAPYSTRMSWIDGLKLLEDIDYEEFQGRQPSLRIIKFCLDKLGFGLDIYEGVNFFDSNMSQDATGDIEESFTDYEESAGGKLLLTVNVSSVYEDFEEGDLVTLQNGIYGEIKDLAILSITETSAGLGFDLEYELDINYIDKGLVSASTITKPGVIPSGLNQAYLNTDAFEGMNYYQVLEEVLKTFKAQIHQEQNKWWILQPNQKAATFKLRKFDSELNYDSTEEISRSVEIDCSTTFKWVGGVPQRNNIFANKKAIIKQDYLTQNNLLKGSSFLEEDFTAGTPNDWFGNSQTKKAVGEDEEKFAVGITGTSTTTGAATYIRQDFRLLTSVLNQSGGDYCELKFKYYVSSPDSYVDGDSLQVAFKLKSTSNDYFNIIPFFDEVEQWLTNNNYWEPTEDFYVIEVTEFNRWHSFSLTFFNTGIANDYELSFFQAVTSDYSVNEVRFSEIGFQFLPSNQPAETGIDYTFENLDYKQRNIREDSVIFGDAPQTAGNATIYRGAITLQNGKPTEFWSQGGDDEDARSLHLILVNEVLKNFKRPSLTINGNLQQLQTTGFLRPSQNFTESSLGIRVFLAGCMIWDVTRDRYEIELVEVITEATYNIWGLFAETGTYILLENGGVILLENS